MIKGPFRWTIAILVFAVAISGCVAVVSYQAEVLSACPPQYICERI